MTEHVSHVVDRGDVPVVEGLVKVGGGAEHGSSMSVTEDTSQSVEGSLIEGVGVVRTCKLMLVTRRDVPGSLRGRLKIGGVVEHEYPCWSLRSETFQVVEGPG